MSSAPSASQEAGFVTVRLSGYVTGKTLLAAVDTVSHDPGWTPGTDVLLDVREVSPLALCPTGLRRLEDALLRLSSSTTRSGVAVVVESDDDVCAIALLLKAKAQGHCDVELFAEPDEALRWLGQRQRRPRNLPTQYLDAVADPSPHEPD